MNTTRLRDLLIDGLLFALPLVVLFYLLAQAFGLVARLLAPLAALAPQGRLLGIAAIDVAAVVVLLLSLVALGAMAGSSGGRALSQRLERLVLRKIPGFLLFKSVASGFSSHERATGFRPALVDFDDNTVLGFIVEPASTEGGLVTVFIPSAPTPAAGSVVLVPSSRVRPLAVTTGNAIQTVGRLGLGLQQLVQTQTPNLPNRSET